MEMTIFKYSLCFVLIFIGIILVTSGMSNLFKGGNKYYYVSYLFKLEGGDSVVSSGYIDTGEGGWLDFNRAERKTKEFQSMDGTRCVDSVIFLSFHEITKKEHDNAILRDT